MAKAMSARAPGGQVSGEGIFESAWRTRCDGCGSPYDLEGWSRLALVTCVEPSVLQGHVTGWPANVVVEVRRCMRCERTVSRRRPAEGSGLRSL